MLSAGLLRSRNRSTNLSRTSIAPSSAPRHLFFRNLITTRIAIPEAGTTSSVDDFLSENNEARLFLAQTSLQVDEPSLLSHSVPDTQDGQPAPGQAEFPEGRACPTVGPSSLGETGAQNVPDRQWRRRDSALSSLSNFQRLKEKLEEYKGESTQKTTQLTELQIRRLKIKVEEQRAQEQYKIAKNSQLKAGTKGPWSYDWRVALLSLRKHTQVDRSPVPESQEIDHLTSRRYRQLPVTAIPIPEEWTQKTFAQYVYDICNSQVSRIANRFIYMSAINMIIDHNMAKRRLLRALFNDPTKYHLFSAPAVNKALRFFFRHEMLTEARDLLNLMTAANFDLPATSFNIVLRAAAISKDLFNFTVLLRKFIGRGFQPNQETWISFIICLESKSVKQLIVNTMRDIGLLQQSEAIQHLVAEILPTELEKCDELNTNLSQVISRFDQEFGTQWFSLRAGNIVCKHLSNNASFDEVHAWLALMKERDCRPNRSSLDFLLARCMRALDADGAISALRLFRFSFGEYPGESAFHLLFLLGWYSRRFNTCKVVWWAACLEGAVTVRMQQLVRSSLLLSTPGTPVRGREHWMKESGKIIAGIEPDSQRGRTNTGTKSMFSKRMIMTRLFKAESELQRKENGQLARVTLYEDLGAFRSYRFYRKDFLRVLARAIRLDDSWQSQGQWTIPFETKLENSIRIPVVAIVRYVTQKRLQRKPRRRKR